MAARQDVRPHVPGEIGIWAFVAGDLIVFSVFFVLVALGNRDEAEVFTRSRASLDLGIGVANTVLLLSGSWFVARGVARCREAHDPRFSRYFSLAILCGLGFVANKGFEWGTKIAAGITPQTNDFYMYFFVFTGIHLVHVLIGIGVLLLVRHTSRRPVLDRRDVRTLETGATFWHLVDFLWIFLFALLYLL
ncbi:MAG: cytochrome c oxidase subunit 3 [Gammaproteobacteria bacterium]|nr:cytochrome c oxidase subunit 3 [Gammaproteobacteria bacterium]